MSNERVEATNTHLRVLIDRAYGFHSPDALIAMAMLTRGGLSRNYRAEQHEQRPTGMAGDPKVAGTLAYVRACSNTPIASWQPKPTVWTS